MILQENEFSSEASEDVRLKARVSEQKEAAMIEEALRKTYGNKSAAAKLLGISRGTLYNKMKDTICFRKLLTYSYAYSTSVKSKIE